MADEVIGLLFGVDGVGVDGASGRKIVEGLTQIIEAINAGKSSVPKIKLQFDTTEASNLINDLEKKLKKIKENASVKISQSNTGRGGTNDDTTKKLQEQAEKYKELSAAIKQWVKDSKQGAKLSAEYAGVSRGYDGEITGTTAGYEKTISQINKTVDALKVLEIQYVTTDDEAEKLGVEKGSVIRPSKEDFAELAQKIGLTTEQYEALFNQMEQGSKTAAKSVEDANRSSQNAWDKQVRNVTEQINRMYDQLSKDPSVRVLADDLRKYMQSGSGNVSELKTRFDAMTRAAAESGISVETWGDKFKATFDGKVRSALAAAATGVFTKYLREIYQNVVAIDEAVVNLQIASGKTRTQVKELISDYSKLAKQLGATTTEVAESADTWLRQGYSAEEATTLIKSSMMLSKLGQMESAEASTALTSAMKGYGVAVEDATSIVDKFTKVDMEAAASAGDIATAMAETATSAKLSGVSMDELIGYVTTVKEVTQDGSESVGVFFKSLFARMNNVSAGNFVDDETGEALNDVETVLNELDIALRGTNDEFRDTSDVLDDVAARWETFTDVERNAIATAMAGTRNIEKFNVLMENYGSAMNYAEVAANSAGTAVEKYEAYTTSIDGKLNSLTATFEQLSQTVLSSELIVGGIEFLTGVVNAIENLYKGIGGLNNILPVAAGTTIAFKILPAVIDKGKTVVATFKKFGTAVEEAAAAGKSFTSAMKAGLHAVGTTATWVQATITTLSIAVSIVMAAYQSAQQEAEEEARKTKERAEAASALSDEISELASEYITLSKAVETDDTAKQSLLETQNSLIEKLGIERSEVERLAKEYGSYEKALASASLEQLKAQAVDLRSDVQTNAETLKNKADSNFFGMDGFMDITGSAATEEGVRALSALFENGYIQSDSIYTYAKPNPTTGLTGFSMYNDGSGYFLDASKLNEVASSNSDWLIKSVSFDIDRRGEYNYFETSEDIQRAYDDLTKMLEVLEEAGTADNHVYEELYKHRLRIGDEMTAYNESVEALNTNLAQQYTLEASITKELPESAKEFEEYRQEIIDSAVSGGRFVGATEDIANAIDDVLSKQSGFEKFYTAVDEAVDEAVDGSTAVVEALKSISDVLGEVQDGFDGLKNALSSLSDDGYLTAEALSNLIKLEESGALAGLKLEDIITRDAHGYKLASDALNQYAHALLASYRVQTTYKTQEDKDNAIANLKTLQAVIATLAQSEENLLEAQKEALEKQQENLNNQLNQYKSLIDIRKDLLSTYEEEVNYQRELSQKRKAVADLSTALDVARLDTSAKGQARVRELEEELKEAQEDLDDLTLDRAIETLSKQLDSQYDEYEKFIDHKLSDIEEAINGLAQASDDADTVIDQKWADDVLDLINQVIIHVSRSNVEVPTSTDPPEGDYGSVLETEVTPSHFASTLENFTISEKVKTRWTSYSDAINGGANEVDGLTVLTKTQFEAAKRNHLSSVSLFGSYQAYLDHLYRITTGILPQYHKGGFVGGAPYIRQNEEFAKLLKGEFVSTPEQIARFMQKTLPDIVSYGASSAKNEFHAPLIEITCESVTKESLPSLEKIVNEAVTKIQKQLDSGMQRSGYKKPTVK